MDRLVQIGRIDGRRFNRRDSIDTRERRHIERAQKIAQENGFFTVESRASALFGQLAMAEGRDEEAVATLQVKARHDCLIRQI